MRGRPDALDCEDARNCCRAGILPARQAKEEPDLSKDKNTIASRRVVLAGGIAAVAGVAGAVTIRKARADDKLEQTVVQYQEGPNDGKKCDDCVNWVAPNACKIVAGTINPNGWCVAFAPKGA